MCKEMASCLAALFVFVLLLSTAVASAQELKPASGLRLVDSTGKVVGDLTGQDVILPIGSDLPKPWVYFVYGDNFFGVPLQVEARGISGGFTWYRGTVFFTEPDCQGSAFVNSTSDDYWQSAPPNALAVVVSGPGAAVFFVTADVYSSVQITRSNLQAAGCQNTSAVERTDLRPATSTMNLASAYVEPFHLKAYGSRGDVNGNGNVEPSDIMYLINYLFAGGQEP